MVECAVTAAAHSTTPSKVHSEPSCRFLRNPTPGLSAATRLALGFEDTSFTPDSGEPMRTPTEGGDDTQSSLQGRWHGRKPVTEGFRSTDYTIA